MSLISSRSLIPKRFQAIAYYYHKAKLHEATYILRNINHSYAKSELQLKQTGKSPP